MNVNLTIGGMCLLVDHTPPGGSKRLYLLFPRTGHHEHQARLLYLAQYEDPNAAAGEKREVPLEGRQFEIAPSGGTPVISLPPEVIDLGTHPGMNRRVPRQFLDGASMHEALRSRVQIGAGNYKSGSVREGATWILDPDPTPRFLATALGWEILNFPGASLSLEIRNRKNDATEERRTLTPLPGGDTINLFILHVPEQEVPDDIPQTLPLPTGQQPNEAEHFAAYYSVLQPSTPGGNPRKPPQPQQVRTPGATISLAANVGSEYTCIIATAPPA